jgi:hypothetical protein
MFWIIVLVACAGGTGGLANAVLTRNGFVLPVVKSIGGESIFIPGFLGNIIVGALAAALSWALYGPAAGLAIVTSPGPAPATLAPSPTVSLSLASLAGAVLVGFAGGRWITSEADKALYRKTAVLVTQGNPDLVAALRQATAFEAYQSVQLARDAKLSRRKQRVDPVTG